MGRALARTSLQICRRTSRLSGTRAARAGISPSRAYEADHMSQNVKAHENIINLIPSEALRNLFDSVVSLGQPPKLRADAPGGADGPQTGNTASFSANLVVPSSQPSNRGLNRRTCATLAAVWLLQVGQWGLLESAGRWNAGCPPPWHGARD